MGVPGNVFQRAPLEVTSHVRESDVRVLSFGIEDDHALTLRFAVLGFGDVVELHRSLGAWLDEVRRHEREKLAQATSKVTVIEFRKRVACVRCGADHYEQPQVEWFGRTGERIGSHCPACMRPGAA